jgi:hypothetical protein
VDLEQSQPSTHLSDKPLDQVRKPLRLIAPQTSAPLTSAPLTSAPLTSAPLTSAPLTSAPLTSAPLTSAPLTSAAPTSAAPTSATPILPSLRRYHCHHCSHDFRSEYQLECHRVCLRLKKRQERERQKKERQKKERQKKKWICVDASKDGFLAKCTACQSEKQYGLYYTAINQ